MIGKGGRWLNLLPAAKVSSFSSIPQPRGAAVLARRLLFGLVCVAGLTALLGGLLYGTANGPADPPGYDPARFHNAEFREVVQRVNQEFEERWQEAGVSPAPRASDLAIMRRISLGLTGTVPSLEEIRLYEEARPEHAEQWWLSRLFPDRRYADYVAERLARAYVGTENGPVLLYRRRRFVLWLSDQLHENIPYDQLVRQLISDTGVWTDKPAVNFLTATCTEDNGSQPDPVRLASRTTRAFLGVRLDCMQCHDDNLEGRWEQSDFHELAAFFAPASSSLKGIRDKSQAEYEYQYLYADEEVVVSPEPPFNAELLEPGGAPREQLARWVTNDQNKPFARTMVNRAWALLFGKPLVAPIDSIPLEGPYPPGLETLADDFVAHDYDLRRLFRVIAATDAFQRDSQADFEITLDHEDAWAVFPLTRLRPEQVAGGLLQAASLATIDADSHIIKKLIRFGQESEFVKRYGDMGEDEFDDRGGTAPQRLLMLNGKLVKERTEPNPVLNASSRIARLAPSDEKAVDTAYLAVLSRSPAAEEKEYFVNTLRGAKGNQRARRMEDLYWTLINSTEFSWNH
ncbi:MAG: DUF1549 and DUF1553 domain-containing protein [Planctomycetes bacterium]|nr:DUF1549 and DUF1553 domain-containing protein [Planctomycetota bacterium]